MKPNFRTCPQCSTRNRLDKEFCVKCGEPLEGISAGEPVAPKKGKPGFFVSHEDEGQSPLVPLIFVGLTMVVGLVGWRYVSLTPPTDPVTQAARPATIQAPLPAATSVPPDQASLDYQAAMAALQQGDFLNAIRLFRKAADGAPKRPDYRLALADALEKSGAPTGQFLPEYEAAASLPPTNPRTIAAWAKALNRAGRDSDAIRAYGTALQLDPDNLANLREVANLHLVANDLALARPVLEKLVQLQPDDLVIRQSLAKVLEKTGDLNGAITRYEQILTARPQAHLSRSYLAETYMKQNRADDALRVLSDGLALDPSAGLLHREKGRVLDRQGRGPEALLAYREYVRLSPEATDLKVFLQRIEELSAGGGQ